MAIRKFKKIYFCVAENNDKRWNFIQIHSFSHSLSIKEHPYQSDPEYIEEKLKEKFPYLLDFTALYRRKLKRKKIELENW